MKKFLCNTLIIIIMLGVFCNGYFNFGGLSFSDRFSYAEADNWSSCDSSDLVTAFRYYCKSRNLALEGSVADALTSFTTSTFNNICSTLGIDPTTLSAELKKTTQGNLGLRFLFSQTGITAYNRIFAEFLQNNDLAVGDTVDDETIYSGELFTDGNGNTCLVWDLPSSSQGYNNNRLPNKWGTTYKYNGSDIKSIYDNGINTFSFVINRLNGGPYSITENIHFKNSQDGINNIYSSVGIGTDGWASGLFYADSISYGECIVYHVNGGSDLYVGQFCDLRNISSEQFTKNCRWRYFEYFTFPDGLDDADVSMTTNNNTINNNTYNNNYTIIFNNGDTYYTDDDDEPLPDTPPGGGGGQDPDPDDPIDPYDPNKPFPDTPDNPTPDPGIHGTPGSDGTITIPDFNFDIPDINWSLDGLQHKFPFSLPFDLYNACKLLNAEPQTPELDYTVDLVVYQWPIQMDLHWLDPAARVIRIFELLAFVVGLILITRHLIGG